MKHPSPFRFFQSQYSIVNGYRGWNGILMKITIHCILLCQIIYTPYHSLLCCDAFLISSQLPLPQLPPPPQQQQITTHHYMLLYKSDDRYIHRTNQPRSNNPTKLFASLPTTLNYFTEKYHMMSDLDIFNEISSDNAMSSSSTTTIHLSWNSLPLPFENDVAVPIIVIVALTIGILANGWISRLLSGERGLGSYLSDGAGYNKSKFKPILPSNGATTTTNQNKYNDDRAVQGDDPLPWLRLPNLDFVEVAGQTNSPKKSRATSRYTRTIYCSK
jgi:hypothetical protein